MARTVRSSTSKTIGAIFFGESENSSGASRLTGQQEQDLQILAHMSRAQQEDVVAIETSEVNKSNSGTLRKPMAYWLILLNNTMGVYFYVLEGAQYTISEMPKFA